MEQDFEYNLPPEILYEIFKYLPGRQLAKCREVCKLWAQMLHKGDVWKIVCKREYKNAIAEARIKCEQKMSWHNLYKSLSLWSKIQSAKEMWLQFDTGNETKAVKIREGLIAILTHTSIDYYDMKFQRIKQITGFYRDFDENEHVLVLHDTDERFPYDTTLKIIPKTENGPSFNDAVEIDYVSEFKIVDKDVYFTKYCFETTEVYKCGSNGSDLKGVFRRNPNETVIGFRNIDNNLEILTTTAIYIANGTDLIKKRTLKIHDDDYFQLLNEFKFFCDLQAHKIIMNYLLYNEHKRHSLNQGRTYANAIPEEDSPYNLTCACIINNLMIISGYRNGIFKIYPADVSKFESNNPLKRYEIKDFFPAIQNTEFKAMDVADTENGPIVVISVQSEVFILTFDYNNEK